MDIKIENFTKKIKKTYVLKNINLELSSGNIYGIVGQNGSGKTMLLRAISGLIHPTEGRILINEKQLFKDIDFPESIGVIIEKPEFLEHLSGFENLKLLGDIKGTITTERIKEYMYLFSLDPESKQTMKKYSLGMKQKIGIIQAIMEDPDILVLDEPFNALDQETVDVLRKILIDLREKGKLIVVTSHHRDDIEEICNKVIRIDKGKVEIGSTSI